MRFLKYKDYSRSTLPGKRKIITEGSIETTNLSCIGPIRYLISSRNTLRNNKQTVFLQKR